MRTDRLFYVLAAALFVLSWVAVLASWVGSVCGWPVNSLLTPESLRWFLKNATAHFAATPCATLLPLMMGLGVLVESGWLGAAVSACSHKHNLSRKRRQALVLATCAGLCFAAIVGWLTFSRHAMLLGVTGTLERSAFTRGLPLLVALGGTGMGAIYGLSAGSYHQPADVFRSLSSAVAQLAPYVAYLFVAAQGFAIVGHALADESLTAPGTLFDHVRLAAYYLPFAVLLLEYTLQSVRQRPR